MNGWASALRTRLRRRHADRGFTLVELVIAVALSGVIVGVIVAALITSLNVADTTTNAVRDSTDAALISAYLYRDAASAGAIDPATAQRDSTLGVSTTDSVTGWSGCEQLDSLGQPSTLVVRFSWADHHTSAFTYSKVVVTYALDDGLVTRRICKDATTVDVEVGSSITSATATCEPVAACTGQPTSVLLTLKGSGAGAPEFELSASLRGGDTQAAPDSANSSQVALLALGDAPASAPCPNLTLGGTGAITVVGDAFIDGSCGPSPIQGDPATLLHNPTTGVTSSIAGIVDPFFGLISPPPYTCTGINPAPIGKTDADGVVVYPQAVSIAAALAFEPGSYVFCAGLSIGAAAQVTGSDVMFYIAGGTLTVNANARVDLSASTTGADANLLIWVASPQTITLDGGPRVSSFRGLIYAPTSTLRLTSAVAANIGGLIVKDLTVLGAGRARIGLPVPVMTISPALIPAGQVGVAYAPTTLSSSGGTPDYTWSATGMPLGMSINSASGQISGTPTASGPFVVVVTTFDATAAAASIDYLLTIAPQLVITGPATLPSGQVGSPYTPTTMTRSGGTPLAGGPPDYTWSATGLPAGLTINSTTGTISGTPTAAGTYPVTVLVTDAMTTANRAYTITVKLAPRVTTTSPLPNGQAGSAYSTTIAASDGTLPYTWSATGLPAGLTINPTTGAISGTPTAASTFSVNVTVTDAIGAVNTRTFSLTISPPAVALSVTGPATLPVGVQGTGYTSTTVTAVGGVPPYTWSATGLPAGLAISPTTGAISGTPTAAGTFSVTVTVTDSLAASAQRAYTLTVVPPGCPTTPIVGWLGQYYSNRTLSGTSILCRDDASINFNWGNGKPDPILPSTDDFSVRWTRTQDFAAGSYTFTMGSDDGSRLLIDNVLVYNNWVDQAYPAVPPTFTVPLTAGSHTIVMEFYERGGDARATLTWYSCAGPATGWNAEYFNNNSLTGAPTLCRDDADINFNWFAAAPAPVLPIDNFSVRWTRTQNFTAGNYMFTVGSDAGARLRIDGTVVLDNWTAHLYPVSPATPPTIVVPLTAGSHTIVMEYYETTLNARATLTSNSCSGAVGWSGEYYSNTTNPTGTPTFCRDDLSPTFNWGTGIPAPGVSDDNFSVRWTKTESFAAGSYTFTMGSNDGSRLYIDTVLVLDEWTDHAYPTDIPTITVPLTAGNHTIVMEYYESTNNAQSALSWYSCAGPAAGWHGEYYGNNALTGAPTLCRDDASVTFDWGTGSPATFLPANGFSVRWTRTQNFTAGSYTFRLSSDAGARLYIDGVRRINDWGPHVYGQTNHTRTLTAGNHTIMVEYRETNNTDPARVLLTW